MNALARLIAARIRAAGPMTLAEYMAECLLHPRHGYYSTRDPLGAAGDFTTAPEISQMFGELLGLALAQAWLDQGAPAPFVLAELGPGRGTLMADLLRATRSALPAFAAAARVVLVEASPVLRNHQKKTLSDRAVEWTDDIASLPGGPLFLVANEFFDALPVRQFTRDREGWSETVVGLDGAGALSLGRVPAPPPPGAGQAPAGTVIEICPALPAMAEAIGARIASRGGLALIIDYGEWGGRGDTVQAVRHHAFTDPLDAPGEADLTAHVDFEAIARAAAPAAHAFTTQGALLSRLGIDERARRLARANPSAGGPHEIAARRLTGADGMGRLFKALALYPPGAALPPGFA